MPRTDLFNELMDEGSDKPKEYASAQDLKDDIEALVQTAPEKIKAMAQTLIKGIASKEKKAEGLPLHTSIADIYENIPRDAKEELELALVRKAFSMNGLLEGTEDAPEVDLTKLADVELKGMQPPDFATARILDKPRIFIKQIYKDGNPTDEVAVYIGFNQNNVESFNTAITARFKREGNKLLLDDTVGELGTYTCKSESQLLDYFEMDGSKYKDNSPEAKAARGQITTDEYETTFRSRKGIFNRDIFQHWDSDDKEIAKFPDLTVEAEKQKLMEVLSSDYAEALQEMVQRGGEIIQRLNKEIAETERATNEVISQIGSLMRRYSRDSDAKQKVITDLSRSHGARLTVAEITNLVESNTP